MLVNWSVDWVIHGADNKRTGDYCRYRVVFGNYYRVGLELCYEICNFGFDVVP